MAYFPDLSTKTQIADHPSVRAVGWLAADHQYPVGGMPSEFVAKLRALSSKCGASASALEWPVMAGPHRCEFCNNHLGGGEFGVPAGDRLYVAPQMILHYVESHSYCPPAEFVSAVMKSPLPGTAEYASAVQGFNETGRMV